MDYPMDFYPGGDPIPDLALTQDACFLEPAHPTQAGGAGDKLAQRGNFEPPQTFGSLTVTCSQPRGGADTYARSFVRRDQGIFNNDLVRNDSETFERAKFNPLRNPPNNVNCNPNYRLQNRGTPQGFDLRIMDIAVNYPIIANPIMKGPLSPQLDRCTLPAAPQPVAFTIVLQTPELAEMIMEEVVRSGVGNMHNFGRTCQFVTSTMAKTTCLDTNGDRAYLNLVHSRTGLQKERDQGRITEKQFRETAIGSVVIVTPVRGRYAINPDPVERNKFGYPTTPEALLEKRNFASQVNHMVRIIPVFAYHGQRPKVLMLQALPLLDMSFLKAIVKSMPNLEVLSVANCELLNFTYTEQFIDLIVSTNKERGARGKLLRGDFAPYYYTGPKGYREGDYGVVPQCEGHIHTIRAVGARLVKIYRKCRENDIDFFRPGTAFRAWLERLPFKLNTLPYILKALANLQDFYDKRHHLSVATGDVTNHSLCPKGQGKPVISSKMYDAMHATLWKDLIIAIHGKPMSTVDLRKGLGRDGECKLKECATCHVKLPYYFFTDEQVQRQAAYVMCHGCQLDVNLHDTHWNLAKPKRSLMEYIWINDTPRAEVREIDSCSFLMRYEAEVSSRAQSQGRRVCRTPGGLPLFSRQRARAIEDAKRIDVGMRRNIAQQNIRWSEELADLKAKYDDGYRGGVQWASRAVDRMKEIEDSLKNNQGQLAIAQYITEPKQQGDPRAANWDVHRKWYRGMLPGAVVNNGPYVLFQTNNAAVHMTGTGLPQGPIQAGWNGGNGPNGGTGPNGGNTPNGGNALNGSNTTNGGNTQNGGSDTNAVNTQGTQNLSGLANRLNRANEQRAVEFQNLVDNMPLITAQLNPSPQWEDVSVEQKGVHRYVQIYADMPGYQRYSTEDYFGHRAFDTGEHGATLPPLLHHVYDQQCKVGFIQTTEMCRGKEMETNKVIYRWEDNPGKDAPLYGDEDNPSYGWVFSKDLWVKESGLMEW